MKKFKYYFLRSLPIILIVLVIATFAMIADMQEKVDEMYEYNEDEEVNIVVTNKEHMEVFANEKYYPEKLKAQYDLGCDTAEYEISVAFGNEVNSDTINTGADGYYGNVLESKGTCGFTVSFDFPADLMDEKDIRHTLSYLFNCKEIQNIKEEN